MSMFDAGKVCLFSKISGVITLDGEPAANAHIVRTVNLSRDKVDETYTDENGYFEMPAVFQRTVTKFLPQEFTAKQTVVVHYEGEKYTIWRGVKRDPSENTEARGKDLQVACELTSEENLTIVDDAPIFSLCKWDVESDKEMDIF